MSREIKRKTSLEGDSMKREKGERELGRLWGFVAFYLWFLVSALCKLKEEKKMVFEKSNNIEAQILSRIYVQNDLS